MPAGDEHAHSSLIDRHQHILIPMGDFSAVRTSRLPNRLLRSVRRNWRQYSTAAGFVAALLGAALNVSTPPVTAYLSGNTVHVGRSVLTQATNTTVPGELYTGDGTYLLSVQSDGSVTAGGVMSEGGHEVSGRCQMVAPSTTGLFEHCSFSQSGSQYTADDTLEFKHPGTWQRRYSDGRTVSIGVPINGSAIPMPFPIGH